MGGNLRSFHFLSFDFVCLFVCFVVVFVVFFRISVLHSSLGRTFSYVTPNVCCPFGIVFLATLGTMCHFSLGVGKTLLSISFYFQLFVCLFISCCLCVFCLKKKKNCHVVDWHELHCDCGLHFIGLFNILNTLCHQKSESFDSFLV